MRILLVICAFGAFISPAVCPKVIPVVEGFALTDGLCWDEGKLYFVDTTASKICAYHASSGGNVFCALLAVPHVYFVVPVENHPDKFLVGTDNDILLVEWDTSSNVVYPTFQKLISVDEHIHGNRINHGGVDPTGRLWFGTVNNPPGTFKRNLGAVYTLDSKLELTKQIWPVSLSNGFAWFVQRNNIPRFYYIDAMTFEIVAYNYHLQLGTVDKKETIIHLPSHGANGFGGRLAVDDRGFLWVPIYGESRVIEIDPYTETVHRSIHIPAAKVGGCTFGGSQFDVLYVATIGYGHENPNEQRPHNDWGGHIFAVYDLGVKGSLTRRFWTNHL